MTKTIYEFKAMALLSSFRKATNTEKVLSELLIMREKNPIYSIVEIRDIVLSAHTDMSESQLAKSLHELKKMNYLVRDVNKYTLNFK